MMPLEALADGDGLRRIGVGVVPLPCYCMVPSQLATGRAGGRARV